MSGLDPVTRGRVQLLMVALVFLGPLLLAWLIYAGRLDWGPDSGTAHGVLLQSPVTLPGDELVGAAPDDPDRSARLRAKWSLVIFDRGDCAEGKQILELLTVADFGRFRDLKFANARAYNKKKNAVFDAMLKVLERDYVPGLREHLCFTMLGSPTTNERYCLSPAGNSYGSNMTPENIGAGRLSHESSVPGLYFCNASSGYAGFSGTVWTGTRLYETLTGDRVL